MDEPILQTAAVFEESAVYLRPDPAVDMLFDPCCGTGETAAFFAPKVKMVVASDTSMAVLKKAQELLSEKKALANVSFREADPEDLPFPAGAFSLLCCRRVFQCFSDLDRVLAEFYRVLRWEGRMAVMDPLLPDEPEAATFFQEANRLRDPGFERAFRLEEWQQALGASPFRVDSLHVFTTRIPFADWCRQASMTPGAAGQIKDLFLNAPPEIGRHFKLKTFAGEVEHFTLRHILALAFHPSKPPR